jgi:SAM-dependent methyltransferase
MAAPASIGEVKRANVRYHDLASDEYDAKWGIAYGERGREQVVSKLARALGHTPPRFGRTLEIGAGTGYFTLNLLGAGVVEKATATDISPGMLLALEDSAADLGLEVETVCAEASELPFSDGSFDLVVGHAVLHHLPDLERAFAEFVRVLRPGGTLAFCGEPSRHGDRLASVPKRAALLAAPLWRRVLGAAPRGEGDGEDGAEAAEGASNGRAPAASAALAEAQMLEGVVDVHAFAPPELERHARTAGLEAVRVSGEELAASLFGWANRTLEATAEPSDLPRGWFNFALHGYLVLQRIDRALLEPRLPAAAFYNLLLSARKPA